MKSQRVVRMDCDDDRGWDNRDRSRKWDNSDRGHSRYYNQDSRRYYDSGLPESVAVDELGYQSAGALSDGPTQGYARSSESVGSQGSGGERFFRHRDLIPLMNGETRFPTVPREWYAASEAAKSDIATVCSGSVADDIDIESEIANNVFPSSSERPTFSRRTSSGGRVEFAEFQKEQVSSQEVNDMGPPLSRALLLQQAPFQRGSFSRPGSVRSFGSTAGASSDVAAQVDTDDCAGSFVESFTDGHSVHSQEENMAGGVRADDEGFEAKQKGDLNESNSLLCNGTSSNVPNGRVSPGGTVYKGRGVRRYQGRYMQLPLKRFHQNGVDLGTDGPNDYDTRDHDRWNNCSRGPHRPWDGTGTSSRRPSPDRGYHGHKRSRSRSPVRQSRSPPRGNWRRNNNGNKNSPIRHSYRRDRYSHDRQSESPPRHRHRRRHKNDTESNSR